jgi:transcriptional regulator with XRE-family HTH domain
MASTGIDLVQRRRDLKLSRAQVAKKLGTSAIRVWRIETGRQPLPPSEVPNWARALKLDELDLLRSLVA